MSYGASINGHGPRAAEVKALFEALARDLRAITPEGGAGPSGSAWGSDPGSDPGFNIKFEDVGEVETKESKADDGA